MFWNGWYHIKSVVAFEQGGRRSWIRHASRLLSPGLFRATLARSPPRSTCSVSALVVSGAEYRLRKDDLFGSCGGGQGLWNVPHDAIADLLQGDIFASLLCLPFVVEAVASSHNIRIRLHGLLSDEDMARDGIVGRRNWYMRSNTGKDGAYSSMRECGLPCAHKRIDDIGLAPETPLGDRPSPAPKPAFCSRSIEACRSRQVPEAR
ncbi:hypothetical protein BD626DRAFT_516689 [Schizophyllum amplum]|uniref:Uncharacterized protein n=1 Tax=Schizophyllum amplum TaxID=97359 RepID=A0A550BWT5_9AGAR|nr:hypothetical protein BD626DRAFT_516689 [Auriculariopsis ampla]